MRILSRLVLLFGVSLACYSPVSARAQAIEIKQQWITGKHYEFTAKMGQESSFAIGPQKVEQKTAMTMEMGLTVQPHEDGQQKRLIMKYDRVAMDMTMNGQKMSYDSANPDAGSDPMNIGKGMGAIVGKEVKMLANQKDEITDIENYDEFVKSFPVTPGMDASKMFSKESLQQMMKQGTLQALPGHPVSPGESWPFTRDVEMPQVGKVTVKGTYTYQGMEDHDGVSCAKIVTDATLTMDFNGGGDKASPLNALGMKVTDCSLKGTLWFDLALGTTRDGTFDQDIKMSMKSPADPTASVEIPMKQKVSVVLSKVEDVK